MQKVIGYDRVDSAVRDELQQNYDFVFFQDIDPATDKAFLQELRDAEGIINVGLPFTTDLLDRAPHLKVIANVSTGYNNIDLHEATKRNIMVTNTPGVVEATTADAIFGILIAAARRIPELDARVKNGQWQQALPESDYGLNVHHRTLGIIGMGKVGTEIAKRAYCGFDMNILYYNRTRNTTAEQQYNAQYSELATLLQTADFVCLMTPLTAETKHLIGKAAFQQMKNSAIFINGSRGRTVDETALIDALQSNQIRAAALDVFSQEPINADNPLLHMTNVVTTPHIGSSTEATERKMAQVAVNNLNNGLTGKQPPNLVNPQVWPTQKG